MKWRMRRARRRGAALVLFVISIVALAAFLALSIDLGMIAVARSQCQDAADAAAMAGARTLNGSTSNGSNNNYSSASPNALVAATANTVLGASIGNSQVNTQIGRYVYDTTSQTFQGQIPGPSNLNWSLVQVQVMANIQTQLAFSRVLNFSGGNVQATGTAVHNPRDVAVVLDYSGSMRFASLVGTDYATATRASNNPDTLVPSWGHYSSTSDNLTATSFTSPYDAANITTTTSDGRGPIVQDFYSDNAGTPAFASAAAGFATAPGGDQYLKVNKNTGGTYATNPADLLNIASPGNSSRDATFETSGYAAYGMSTATQGYSQGPGYWGKSFFLWPPDPVNDWRKTFFLYPGTNTPMDDNSRLWDSSGNWKPPGANTYSINYTAILNWIKNTGPNPFPASLQSGRIVYYTQIPSTIDNSSFPPSDLNQRFWKDFIDYALGLIQLSSGSWEVINNGNTGTYSGSGGEGGYGTDFNWNGVLITAKASLQPNASQGNKYPYMHYGDKPLRPRLHFWFGPLSMIDCMGNYNVWYDLNPYCSRFCWWPGTCHEAPLYSCKLGIRAAMTDIQANHPNDQVALAMFSVPQSSSNDNSGARFNRVRVGLSQNYQNMQDSLWYPPATVLGTATTVTPYDANNLEIPRAMGGTCYAMPLMMVYNQFSSNRTLLNYNSGAASGDAGGNGRKGAQKIIIFETDGAPNTSASAGFSNNGAYQSYYNVRYNSASPGGSEFPSGISGYSDNSSSVTSPIYAICNQICALDSANPAGYSTASKKVQIHCLGFGPEFAPGGSNRAANLNTLNQMQIIGNVTDGMPAYKIIYGNQQQIVNSLQQACTQILQSGVQVSLIQ